MASIMPGIERHCVPVWQILLYLRAAFTIAAAFAHVVAHRLFDVHVFAGLDGPDGGQRVPVVGRGDRDGSIDLSSNIFRRSR